MSESETIYSESEVSQDESAYNISVEEFIDDEDVSSPDEGYLPPNKETKKIDITIKTRKMRKPIQLIIQY